MQKEEDIIEEGKKKEKRNVMWYSDGHVSK